MNRFRTRRRDKDETLRTPSSSDAKSTGPFRRFGMGKRTREEEPPRKPIDLTYALPSTDDLRTSLLMTGLSARFSMLREQDDPTTKVGKASDDSVLFPKRQSRMLEFGFAAGLTDIAEVESIRTPRIFPRVDSYNSDDASSTSGSVMNRAKPIEGNNLFGGRQKIYKIAVGATKSAGGMGGRALYENDVASSAFQKRSLEERSRPSLRDSDLTKEETDLEPVRDVSPSTLDFSNRRETSSTTSSIPSVGHHSTAATSIASHHPTVPKEVYHYTPPPSAGLSPVERSTTRTRRLYDQGLSQELQEQQTSALSRIDTLSRRNLNPKSPELSAAPSQSTNPPLDRLSERRYLLTKASAPNLRSYSRSDSHSSLFLPDRSTTPGDQRVAPPTAFLPLTPPVSDNEEVSHLHVPVHHDDATIPSLLSQKPVQVYDETRYAQRQIQMNKDRQSPTQRSRTASNESYAPSDRRQSAARRTSPQWNQLDPNPFTINREEVLADCLTKASDSSIINTLTKVPNTQVNLSPHLGEMVHPLFRDSALPTPLTIGAKSYDHRNQHLSSVTSQPGSSPHPSLTSSQDDAGLSRMVSQHLRAGSNASSVYNATPSSPAGNEISEPLDLQTTGASQSRTASDPWDLQTSDWMSYYGVGATQDDDAQVQQALPVDQLEQSKESEADEEALTNQNDKFAHQLADGARRVRERLTSYVESDSGATSSWLQLETARDVQTHRPIPLGILKPKSSRGSLIDKTREIMSAKPTKPPGPQISTRSPPIQEPVYDDIETISGYEPELANDESCSALEGTEGDQTSHAGLRIFRQAKRELQRQRELETQQRYQCPLPVGPSLPYRERRPPPVTYTRTVEESRSSSRSSSRDPSERDRSGSGTSVGGSRPPRLQIGPSAVDGPGTLSPHGPIIRSPAPAFSGMETRRSPMMPPQPYSGRFERFEPAVNLSVQQPYRGYDSAEVSPVGGNSAPSPFKPVSGRSTPTTMMTPHSSTHSSVGNGTDSRSSRIDDSMRRVVKKKDISGPTFISTTSQVPTVEIQHRKVASRSRSVPRSRSSSQSGTAPPYPPAGVHAPPLPAINPMRRNVLGAFRGRRDEDMVASTPHLPLPPLAPAMSDAMDDGRSAFSVSDDEDCNGRDRRKLHRTIIGATLPGLAGRPRTTRGPSPPFASLGKHEGPRFMAHNGMI